MCECPAPIAGDTEPYGRQAVPVSCNAVALQRAPARTIYRVPGCLKTVPTPIAGDLPISSATQDGRNLEMRTNIEGDSWPAAGIELRMSGG